MISFHGKPELKDQLLKNLRAHHAADEFYQGHYWDDGKGCAVGCSIVDFGGNTGDHEEYERLFGIPRVLARLEDGIFEGLSVDESKWWPIAFIEAIPVGVEMVLVFYRFMEWLLIDPSDGVIKYASENSKAPIVAVGEAMGLVAGGADRGSIDWPKLRRAAADDTYDAAANAAANAAVAAANAANADADAADDAADAADAAADAAVAADTREISRKKQAMKLIEIMSAL
jgi:hypothetical protein